MKLNVLGLSAQIIGTAETVTDQIPAAGQSIPGNSQVILYFGEEPEKTNTQVPDFTGMTRQQASDAAAEAGLYILVTGNQGTASNIVVTAQSESPGTQVSIGTVIKLEFADTQAAD